MCSHQINTFNVNKDEWNTKEDTGKSRKNVLVVLQYAKRYLSGWSNVKQWKIKPVALAIIELFWFESIS